MCEWHDFDEPSSLYCYMGTASREKGFYDLNYPALTEISVDWRKIRVFFLKEKLNTIIKIEIA